MIGLKILIMDDEILICDLLKQMLEHLEHQVEMSCHGKEALNKYLKAAFDGVPFDLVILDLIIPSGMGGIETLEKLKEINQKIIVIASSGYSNENPQGFSAFLPKSYNLEKLKKVLEDAFK